MTWPQKRQYPRIKTNVAVELRRPVITTPIRAQTADLCLGGCYLEMAFTQEVSSEVDIVFWIGENKIRAKGVVVSSHPNVGNGLKFTYISPEDQFVLKNYLETLQHAGRLMGIS
jgi:c-di-GMP-binding flagellar brake protein YcgR